MGIYEELQARGLIAQVTDEERIKELVNNGKATFYIGFDPTADSLHAGHRDGKSNSIICDFYKEKYDWKRNMKTLLEGLVETDEYYRRTGKDRRRD